MNDLIRVPYDTLVSAIIEAFLEAGMDEEVARVEARLAVDADAHGVPSHGVLRVPGTLKALRDGRLHATPAIKLLRDRAAVCVLDGDKGPGRYVSTRAMDEAISRARNAGIGACLAVRTSHWGRAHAYAAQAAQAGFVGIAMTNAVTSMAGWGAVSKVVGNNPIAVGIPGPNADEPVVLDLAMSQAAVGKVETFRREGKPIPANWGLGADGKATTDPNLILSGGPVLPMGGHKGAGLALMVQLLTAGLAGGPLDHELRELDASGLDAASTKLFLVLDPQAFAEPGVLAGRTATVLEWLTGHAGTSEPFLAPGQRGWAHARECASLGVPIHPDIVRSLADAGVRWK